MIDPLTDSQRRLELHLQWEVVRMADALKECMRQRKFDANELIRQRIISANSLSSFLDSHKPVEIATLILITQYLGFDFCFDFRNPFNRAGRVIVRLPGAKSADIVRAINTGFRTLRKDRQVKEVADAAQLSIKTVYNFIRVVPQYPVVAVDVAVPDLLTVFKCARGCGYETYLWIANRL
jgi:hypothetical protein